MGYYPDIVEFEGGSVLEYDNQLNVVENTTTGTVRRSRCRIEKNSAGLTISGIDGKTYVYKYILYLPKESSNEIPVRGSKIRISKEDGSIEREEHIISDFSVGKFNAKIWI